MQVPGYQIQHILGEGGMAKVYLATQESLGRAVALKIMAADLVDTDKTFCDRFVKEGKIIAELRHVNIVTIFDIGCTMDNVYYMSMEYCPGGTLRDRMRAPNGVGEPNAIIQQVAAALGYAHEKGFVHRDIKPGNVLFREDGTAVLSDFGIAKTIDDRSQMTQSGLAIGTPEYMSPEQALGSKLDGRSDLYSLGVVLYELLVGQKPFNGRDAVSTALMRLEAPVPRLPSHHSRWQHIMDGLMEKHPEERFQSCAELIVELEALRRATAPHVEDDVTRSVEIPTKGVAMPTRLKQGVPVPKRSTTKWLPAGLVALSLLGVGGWYWREQAADVPAKPTEPYDFELLPWPKVDLEEDTDPKTLSPEAQRRLTHLLAIARAHVAVGRLREPVGSNALEAYKLVLEVDPTNGEALDAIEQIERPGSSD
jgi:serine/threonine-protein kinase PpkA